MSEFGPVPSWARRRMQRVRERSRGGKVVRWIAFAASDRMQAPPMVPAEVASAAPAGNVIPFAPRATGAEADNAAA
ncbi:hypothetical protein [Methylobacterium sp. ID0610]|uniref:hypothetical protein n=1 Tax=Methylobacterium carpenticola TaxID=3344827 RepID=UPI0036759BDB